MSEEDHPFEYYETQIEERSGNEEVLALIEPPAPPREAGSDWEFMEKFRSGALVVFRWKRKVQKHGKASQPKA
jgi:hypothetical protein